MKVFRIVLFSLLPLLLLWADPAAAQDFHRGRRQVVRKGRMERPDSLKLRRDSVERVIMRDSLILGRFMQDSLKTHADSVRRRATIDSLVQARMKADSARLRTDSVPSVCDSLAEKKPSGQLDSLTGRAVERAGCDSLGGSDTTARRKGWFMSDSMSLSKVCWLSTFLPGYGQVYNRQYWKLPVLYGLVGTGLALYINENKTYKPLRRAFNAYTDASVDRTPELDALQRRMIRSNTRRQIYLGAAIASYIYFIGDAAVNYKTNDVSRVKKATTLACIFPGAGQIYNKSYWKVPFVVGGFASMVYCIDWNNRGYKRFKRAYSLLADYEKNPDKYPDGPQDEFRGHYSPEFIRDLRNNYRRNRDLCIIVTSALYVLQIIDAHVDAHLKDYDISDDLSMTLEPMVEYNYIPKEQSHQPVFGFNLKVNF